MAIIGGNSRSEPKPRRKFRPTSKPCIHRSVSPTGDHSFKTCHNKTKTVDLYDCSLLGVQVMAHSYCNGPKSCAQCDKYVQQETP